MESGFSLDPQFVPTQDLVGAGHRALDPIIPDLGFRV